MLPKKMGYCQLKDLETTGNSRLLTLQVCRMDRIHPLCNKGITVLLCSFIPR